MSETGSGGRRRGSLFDDLAGVAGGAFSALAGARAEMEAAARAQVDAMVQRLDLVKREDFDAAMELARRAREAQEALESRVVALEARLATMAASSLTAGPEAAGIAAGEAIQPPQAAGVPPTEKTEATPDGV
ncbi:accessory factor UbiK family protein [Paracraurococcus lichenis]|uniref:Accessory factor UbiK family protein n=1 Tax=Paracraurococcus lichenis TaxID=3064888 RepID=A0ABT9E0X0_9PROT|nr:accessory factor UbiK family protein [Paracraurococcus sp. LOR1-02]MDO9709810.1 accessory factor UbiK family protein [Paracraurococcus sp. LOR1-02]